MELAIVGVGVVVGVEDEVAKEFAFTDAMEARALIPWKSM